MHFNQDDEICDSISVIRPNLKIILHEAIVALDISTRVLHEQLDNGWTHMYTATIAMRSKSNTHAYVTVYTLLIEAPYPCSYALNIRMVLT